MPNQNNWPPLPKDVSRLRCSEDHYGVIFRIAEPAPRRPVRGEHYITDSGASILSYCRDSMGPGDMFGRLRWIVVPADRKPLPLVAGSIRSIKAGALSGNLLGRTVVKCYLDQLEKTQNGF